MSSIALTTPSAVSLQEGGDARNVHAAPVQRVIVVHQIAYCPKVNNWTPCVAVVSYVLLLAMVAACLISVGNFGIWDNIYNLRSEPYTWWTLVPTCTGIPVDTPDTYQVSLRRDIKEANIKAACNLPDDTRVCYTGRASDGCVKAADITWIWSLSLALFLSVWLLTCVVIFVFVMRPTHLSNANLRRCGRRDRSADAAEDNNR